MSGINLAARPRGMGDDKAKIRELERQVAYLRSSRALSLRSVLAGMVEGSDSLAGAALAAAVAAQAAADAKAVIKGGTASGTTDGAGEFTVTHTLGMAPVLTSAQVLGSDTLTCAPVSSTTSTATFVLVDRVSGAQASTAYSVRWAVIA